MTERERLIKLLAYFHLWSGIEEKMADYLLANGVRLPVRCGECKNHYIRGGWHCWSGNKSLGLCRWNETPHPLAKHWNYKYKRGKVVAYKDIERVNING